MNRFKSIRRILLVSIFSLLLILFGNTQSIHASTSTRKDSDYQNALKTAPKGLSWDDNDFLKANFADNQAGVESVTNSDGKKTSIIKVTNDFYQVGGIWSNQKEDNYFDVSHDQTASMWLYFGQEKSVSPAPGDGMAFVLQNDERGSDAIATGIDKNSGKIVPANGQSLGVWGPDWTLKGNTSANVASTAIQNSWALEFDTFLDDITEPSLLGEGVTFDHNLKGQHIAYNYPADPNTYIKFGQMYSNFTMNHLGVKDNLNLVDGKWHHLTIHWTKPKPNSSIGQMSYYYNDKNNSINDAGEVITDPNKTISTKEIDVDLTKLGLFADHKPGDKYDLSKENTKLHWGFTGSTGKFYENNLIIFESIPSFVDAEATSTIHDDTSNSDIDSTYNQVDPNDELTYNYTLTYNGWTKTWDNINAHMPIPKNINFSSGSVYFPTSKDSYVIPSESFSNKKSIDYQLKKSLTSDNRTAIFSLKGKAAPLSPNGLEVPSVNASFIGDNLITDANTPAFKINKRLLNLSSTSPDPIKVKINESATVLGNLSYNNGQFLANDNMLVHEYLNGKYLDTTRLSFQNPASGFKLNIKSADLKMKNNFKFFVTDADGNISNTITREIDVGGSVSFGDISSNISFKTTHTLIKNQLIPRMNDWHINVNDNRDKGSGWTVLAKATELTDRKTNHILNGNIVYKDMDGKISNLTNNVPIASNIKDSDNSETKNIADSWNANNGILLFLSSQNTAGNYSGNISWTLSDSLTNS